MAREWSGIQQFPLATQTKLLEILGTLKEKERNSLTILVMGKGGVGKSSTVNSILGERAVAVSAFQSDVPRPVMVSRESSGFTLNIIDTPGIVEGGYVNDQALDLIKRFLLNKTIDVLLYVDRLDSYRVDNLDTQIVNAITESFGKEMWHKGIIVLTHAQLTPPDCLAYDDFFAKRSEALLKVVESGARFKRREILGHRLKNSKCRLLRELKLLPVENKLLLTGTPLQNNLAELWSLLNSILPDIFSSHEEFESWFDFSGKSNSVEAEEGRKAQVVTKLHAILRPFLLRRMKEDVELSLPRKKEIILYATLTEHQRNFQDHLVNKSLEAYLREKVDTGRGTKGQLNNLMIQLRKNCNHPDLLEAAFEGSCFYPPLEQIVGQCGKFQLLERLLQKLLARKHKVLIFSQWIKILDVMHYYFSEKGMEVCRIDGTVKLEDRRRQIQDFNDVESKYRIFLISTRAGGLGINLTAADTCIIYDSDWNPQMDLQAMDRCHRIGQTKPVHVYRLATALSIEGRMLKRAFSKLRLEHVVIGKGQFQQERVTKSNNNEVMDEEDMLSLLRDDDDPEDKMIQTDISEDDLEKVLDRSDLIAAGPTKADGRPDFLVSTLPLKGPGWEVVIPTAAGGMLSTVNT